MEAQLLNLLYVVVALVSIIIVICFFYLCNNISKIRNLFEAERRERKQKEQKAEVPLLRSSEKKFEAAEKIYNEITKNKKAEH